MSDEIEAELPANYQPGPDLKQTPAPVGEAAVSAAESDLIEALKHTVEYVGLKTLPPRAGWSWFDALSKHAPAVLSAIIDPSSSPLHVTTFELVSNGDHPIPVGEADIRADERAKVAEQFVDYIYTDEHPGMSREGAQGYEDAYELVKELAATLTPTEVES